MQKFGSLRGLLWGSMLLACVAWGADPAAYVGQGFIWQGGASGDWFAEGAWLDLSGAPASWEDGQKAIFLESAVVNLDATASASGLELRAPAVTINGSGSLVLADRSAIYDFAQCQLTFNADVSLGNDVACLSAGKAREYFAGEEMLWKSGKQLSNLLPETLTATAEIFWGTVQPERFLGYSASTEGYNRYSYDPETQTATVQLRIWQTDSYGVIINCVKLQFTQRGSDIYLSLVYAKTAGGEWDLDKTIGETSVYEIDFDRKDYRNNAKLVGPETALQNYWFRIYNINAEFAGSDADPKPTYNINGNLTTVEGLGISNIIFKVNGTWETKPRLKIENSAEFVVGQGGTVRWSNNGSQDNVRKVYGNVEVYGTLVLFKTPAGNGANGYGPYQIINDAIINVRNGGVMRVDTDQWWPYGFNYCDIRLYTGGTLDILKAQTIGLNNHNWIRLLGGTVNFHAGLVTQQCLHRVTSEGGTINGTAAYVGPEYYQRPSTWSIGGTSPTTINLNALQVGQASKSYLEANLLIGRLDATVLDATSSPEADLIINAALQAPANVTIEDPALSRVGLRKLGAGTLRLNAAQNTIAGAVACENGTVQIAPTATLNATALFLAGGSFDCTSSKGNTFEKWSLQAPSTLACAGGTVDLGTLLDWSAGATLTLTGELKKNSVKVGADDSALTPEQLSAISYYNSNLQRTYPVTLSADGYLLPPASGFILLLK